MSENKIAIFDFDYTLVNANSSNYLNKLVIERENVAKTRTPSIAETNKYRYSDEIESFHDSRDHTLRLNKVLEYMHSKHALTRNDMEKCVVDLKISASMKNLLQMLDKQSYALAIVSDSNKFVIETILKQNGVYGLFGDNVYANESVFDEKTGQLTIVPLSKCFNPNGDYFNCESENCRRNICKGKIVEHLISKYSQSGQRRNGDRVIYIGDGRIDYCAGLKLNENDFFFVKKNSALMKLLEDGGKSNKIRANLKYWNNGDDILLQI